MSGIKRHSISITINFINKEFTKFYINEMWEARLILLKSYWLEGDIETTIKTNLICIFNEFQNYQ